MMALGGSHAQQADPLPAVPAALRQCGQPLQVLAYCPPCAGRNGGSSRSAKKLEASRRNIMTTRLMREKRCRERRERGQIIRL